MTRTHYHQIFINPFPSKETVPMDKLRARAKAIAAVLIPLGAIVVATISNSDVTNVWLAVVAVLTALGVYVTPNKPAAG